MTIATSANSISYTGDGVSVAFAFPYPFITTADLKVYVNGVLQTTGYSVAGTAPVTGSGTYASGTVTFVTAPASPLAVLIYCDPDLLQSTSLPANDPFPSKTVEKMADKLTLLVQRLASKFGNALRAPEGEVGNFVTGSAASRAGTVYGFDASGNYTPVAVQASTSFTYGQTVIDSFTGDGTTTVFTLSANPGLQANLTVVVGGIVQDNGVDFTWASGTTLTFVSAPPAVAIRVRYTRSLPIGTSDAGITAYSTSATYAAGTVGAALQALGLTTAASVGAGLVAFAPAFGPTYGTGSVGARVNKAGHPSQTNTIVGFSGFDDHLLTGTIGYRTTAFGVQALQNNGSSVSAGGSNSAFGFGALTANIDGSGNNAFGALALNALTGLAASHNNGFGYRVLSASTGGVQNNGFGFQVLNSLTTGNDNCGFGESVLTTTTNSNFCTGMGFNTLYSKTSGDYSVAYGSQACFGETTAVGNTGIGKEALFNFTSQGGNTAVGYEAGRGVAGGVNNSFVGYQAGTAINGGTLNVGLGYWSLLRLTTGASNTAVGQQAGSFITSGSSNVCVGDSSGFGVATSSSNVAIGSGALVNMDSGTNTAVGFGAAAPGSAQTWVNTTSLGNNAQPTGSNQVTLGNASVATLRCQVTTITALSDARDKKDIAALEIPEAFIDEVRPVMYRWAMRDGTDRGADLHAGVIAQELDALQERYGLQWLRLVDKSDPDRWEATPGNLLMPLFLSHQKLRTRFADFESRLAALESR